MCWDAVLLLAQRRNQVLDQAMSRTAWRFQPMLNWNGNQLPGLRATSCVPCLVAAPHAPPIPAKVHDAPRTGHAPECSQHAGVLSAQCPGLGLGVSMR